MDRRESGSKFGGAHRVRVQLMPQFQTKIPDPLAEQLPYLLTPGRVTDPSVGILLLVFVRQCCFKSATV